MKRLIPLFAVATLAAGTASVQAQGLYGEVGYTPLKLESRVGGLDFSSRPSNVRGIIGYELNDNLAVEGMLGLSAQDSSVKVNGINSGVKSEVDNMVGVFVKPKIEVVEGLELFGRLGAARTKLSVGNETDSATSVAYGFGASYKLNPALSLNADYMTYHDKDDTTLKGVTVGVGYKF
jgi:opacity protein-like surface antigen